MLKVGVDMSLARDATAQINGWGGFWMLTTRNVEG
jgi:hypothetical protein